MNNYSPSARIRSVQSPVISLMGSLIGRYPGTIPLGQGMVGYPPPPQALQLAQDAIQRGDMHTYQNTAGLPALRQAFRAKLIRENGLLDPQEETVVMVTAGSNMGFHHVIQAVADPGEEIILLTPFYFNHEMAVRIAGCRPVPVDTDSYFQPDPENILHRITARTRAIVTISPNNPTGAVYPEGLLREINELCGRRGLYHIHDEAYEHFLYEDTVHTSPLSFGGNLSYTIGLHSLSKSYGMAGWRIGFLTIPKHLEAFILKIQDTVLICPPILSQHLALGALQAGSDYCRSFLPGLAETRMLFLQALQHVDFLRTLAVPQGAFYFLIQPRISMDSLPCAQRLVREFSVGVIPGKAFGCLDCALRISFGSTPKDLALEGLQRLITGLSMMASRGANNRR